MPASNVCGVSDQLGTVEPGKLAHILVVASDPLQGLSALGETQLAIQYEYQYGQGWRRKSALIPGNDRLFVHH